MKSLFTALITIFSISSYANNKELCKEYVQRYLKSNNLEYFVVFKKLELQSNICDVIVSTDFRDETCEDTIMFFKIDTDYSRLLNVETKYGFCEYDY
jgi:hypothetical protein